MNPVFIQLRQARKEKKLTLQMVAQRLAIDVAILSKMERGLRPISEKQLKAFCKLYQLDFFLIQKTATAEEIIEILKGYDDPQEILKLAESQLEYVPTKKINMNKVVPTLKRIFKKFPSLQSAWIFGSLARGNIDQPVISIFSSMPIMDSAIFN